VLLEDGGHFEVCRRKAHWTETCDLCFANCSTHTTLSASESPFSLSNIMDQERERDRRVSGIAHAIKTLISAVSFNGGNIHFRAFSKPLCPLETAPIILVHAISKHYE
jgi:hypothetical protein